MAAMAERYDQALPAPFDGLFLKLLCTIDALSNESLAPPCRGANAFWGLHAAAAIRTQFATGVALGTELAIAPSGVFPESATSEPICSCQWHVLLAMAPCTRETERRMITETPNPRHEALRYVPQNRFPTESH